ncbi:MAG: hypothetical protein E6R13_09205 [Spirochaetes bacterium]|nr:MAG: hypothetical protein E6R13_09205 [Spirochaetota bacterium]
MSFTKVDADKIRAEMCSYQPGSTCTIKLYNYTIKTVIVSDGNDPTFYIIQVYDEQNQPMLEDWDMLKIVENLGNVDHFHKLFQKLRWEYLRSILPPPKYGEKFKYDYMDYVISGTHKISIYNVETIQCGDKTYDILYKDDILSICHPYSGYNHVIMKGKMGHNFAMLAICEDWLSKGYLTYKLPEEPKTTKKDEILKMLDGYMDDRRDMQNANIQSKLDELQKEIDELDLNIMDLIDEKSKKQEQIHSLKAEDDEQKKELKNLEQLIDLVNRHM